MNTNISREGDDQVSGLLAGLPRVSAPTDFDLRLRGRIAQRRTAPAQGFRIPAAVTYALGLGVVLVAFGLLGMAWIYSGKVGDVPDVATTTIEPAAIKPQEPAVVVPTTPAPAPSAEILRAEAKTNESTPVVRPAANLVKTAASPAPSVEVVPDSALKQARAVYPQGIHPGPANTPEVKAATVTSMDAKDVLAVLGVNAAVAGGRVRIGSVNAGSAAENAGLKAGDVIESIDDRRVGARASFPGGYLAKSISVIRDGKVVKVAVGK